VTDRVSVALCTYNGARYIAEQIDSILSQELVPTEIVLADDGSTDGTVELAWRAYAAHVDSTVKLRVLPPQAHLGVTRNFERAVLAAENELIALCDQDDVWRSDRLSSAVLSFDRDPSLLLQHSDATLIDATGNSVGSTLLDALRLSPRERGAIADGQAFSAYIRRNLVTGATVIFRRRLLDAAIPFPLGWVHDEWLAIIAAALGTVELLDEPLIDYRQHGSNQIGVSAPTLGYRVRRMLEPRGARYEMLSRRADVLLDRLIQLKAPSSTIACAADKARFERVRAALPRRRLSRVRTVLLELRRGAYDRLSSQGNLDMARDLLQPA